MISTKLEKTVVKLLQQKATAQFSDTSKPNNNLYEESLAYGDLISNFKDLMRSEVLTFDQQKKLLPNEYNMFSGNIWQNIRVNVNVQYNHAGQGINLSDHEINMFKYLDTLSKITQATVSKYCDIILNENHNLSELNLGMLKLYFNKLFVPIYNEWKKKQYTNNVIQKLEEFNKILSSIDSKIYFQRAFMENFNHITCNIDKNIKTETEQIDFIKKMIMFLRTQEECNEKLVPQRTNQTNEKTILQTTNQTDEKQQMKTINNSVTTINDNSITKVDNQKHEQNIYNKNNNKKKVIIINNNTKTEEPKVCHPKLKEKDLDNLKVQGLKDECKKRNLNTSKCSKRADYVELLLKNSK